MPHASSAVPPQPCHALSIAKDDVIDIIGKQSDCYYIMYVPPAVEVLSLSTSGRDAPASYSFDMRAGGRATQQLFSDECWTVKCVSLHASIAQAWWRLILQGHCGSWSTRWG